MNYIAYIWLYYGYSSTYIIPTRFIIVFVYNRFDQFFLYRLSLLDLPCYF